MILILDDSPNIQASFSQKFVNCFHCFYIGDTIKCLERYDIDTLYLDYDLNGNEPGMGADNTGWAVAKWLSENQDRMPKEVIIHSLNHSGARAIQETIEAKHQPGAWE